MTELEIHPLTPERLSDLARLFGQGGDPRWCWCAWFRLRSADFRKSNPDLNRHILEQAVDTTAAEDRSPGLVAYMEADPVGWVSLGPRDDYLRLQHSRVLAPVDDQPTWSVVCFVVSRGARRQGVASILLGAAVEYAREHGASRLEGYPVEIAGQRIPSANAYMGTLSMFRRAGFEVVERRQAAPNTVVRHIVRKELSG